MEYFWSKCLKNSKNLYHGDHINSKINILDIPGLSRIFFWFFLDNGMENLGTFPGHMAKKQ